jgi:hypothetical protein
VHLFFVNHTCFAGSPGLEEQAGLASSLFFGSFFSFSPLHSIPWENKRLGEVRPPANYKFNCSCSPENFSGGDAMCIGNFRNYEECPDRFHPEHPVCAACIDSQIRAALKINEPREAYVPAQIEERSSCHDPISF